jgi:integrase
MSATITVQEAAEAYLTERETELSDSSIQNHRYQIKQFRTWCSDNDIDGIESIEAITLSRFRRDRSTEINNNTLYNQLSVLRLFLAFCARMQWCDEHIPESIVLPQRDGQARHTAIESDRVEAILSDLDDYRFASVDHVILSLLWTTGMRIGALRALDVGDVHIEERWIDVRHCPDTETPLKNKHNSEREINLHDWVADALDAWVSDRRPDTSDGYGREPLIATASGRAARSTIRSVVYKLTACGDVGQGCQCSNYPSKCDSAVSPHDIRRSSISAWLDKGVDSSLLSDRVDTSKEMMDKHYDVRSEEEKRRRRKDAFDM